ncbi:hypothetical protein RYX36_026889 [Vicia faba]
MDEVTESKVHNQAFNELDLNLSHPPFKTLVKQIIKSFLKQKQQEQERNIGFINLLLFPVTTRESLG